jgi:outer membrane lipoprotein-sorting protein
MKQFLITAITLSLLLALVVQLQAQEPTALEILQKTDEVGTAANDQHSLSTMTLIDKDGDEKVRKTEMFERGGEDKRLVRFLSPADQKGISFLSLPDDKMYVYLPAFKKIRTIASHVKNENFAGTDFSYDDIGSTGFVEDYDPELLETTDEFYVLELTPKPESEKDYGKLQIWVRKDIFFIVKTEYYDKGGNLWKIMDRRRIEQIGDYWFAMEIEMKDVKKNHSTKSVTDSMEVDTGLKDSIFTQRNLKRVR